MESLGIECHYEACNIKKGELKNFIQKVKDENILGFNITMPHKVDIIDFLDELDRRKYKIQLRKYSKT